MSCKHCDRWAQATAPTSLEGWQAVRQCPVLQVGFEWKVRSKVYRYIQWWGSLKGRATSDNILWHLQHWENCTKPLFDNSCSEHHFGHNCCQACKLPSCLHCCQHLQCCPPINRLPGLIFRRSRLKTTFHWLCQRIQEIPIDWMLCARSLVSSGSLVGSEMMANCGSEPDQDMMTGF